MAKASASRPGCRAVGIHRHRHRAQARRPGGGYRARIGGRLHQNGATGRRDGPEAHGQGALPAGRDQDVVRGHPPPAMVANIAAQGRQAVRRGRGPRRPAGGPRGPERRPGSGSAGASRAGSRPPWRSYPRAGGAAARGDDRVEVRPARATVCQAVSGTPSARRCRRRATNVPLPGRVTTSPLGGQRGDRLRHGGGAHPVAPGQLAAAGQPVARRQPVSIARRLEASSAELLLSDMKNS